MHVPLVRGGDHARIDCRVTSPRARWQPREPARRRFQRVARDRRLQVDARPLEAPFLGALHAARVERPRGVALAGQLTYEKLQSGPAIDAVGGMAVGAVPYVSAVLAAAAERDPESGLLGFFVRKETKKHGLGRRVEGGFAPGQTVALVEDTTTTGGSTLEAIAVLKGHGLQVVGVVAIVDRLEGGAPRIRAEVPFTALYTRRDFMADA